MNNLQQIERIKFLRQEFEIDLFTAKKIVRGEELLDDCDQIKYATYNESQAGRILRKIIADLYPTADNLKPKSAKNEI